MADNTVGPDELGNPDRARLIAQCDVENDIDMIVNYRFDAHDGAVGAGADGQWRQ